MVDELVSFETAKLAKEKGYTLPVNNYSDKFYKDNILHKVSYKATLLGINDELEVPTQSLLQRWLRETHNTDIEARGVRYAGEEKTSYYQPYINGCVIGTRNNARHDTYEQALEIGLQEGLKLIK